MADRHEGLSSAAMLDLALAAEGSSFAAFVRSDHCLSLEGGRSRPASDRFELLKEELQIVLGACGASGAKSSTGACTSSRVVSFP